MAVKIKRERPDQRRHHRVTAPMFVTYANHTLRAADWSLGGLRIENYPGELPSAGAEVSLGLMLPFQGFDVSFNAKAEVVRNDPASSMFSVRFIEIGERERELMQHFIEELVRGLMVPVQDTIQRIDMPVTPASLQPDQKPASVARPSAAQKAHIPVRRMPVKTITMTGFYSFLGMAILGYAVILAYTNFFRMEVQTAVISAPVETVTAQADGKVNWTTLKPGDEVKAGDVVLELTDNQLEREIELAEIAVQERKAQLAYVKKRYSDELEKIRGFATVEMKNVQQTKVELESISGQLQLAKNQLHRVRTLHDRGYTTESKLEDAERQVITLQKTLESRKIELNSRIELADQNIGKRLYNGDNLVGQASELEAQVQLAQHEIMLAQQKHLTVLNQRGRAAVRAPFDGTILELPRINEGAVRRGDVIAIIEQRKERRVTAFLTQQEVMKVGLGDEAIIFMPALGETVKGRVAGIDRTSGFVRGQDLRVGSGYSWRGPTDRSAKIEIEFENPQQIKDHDRYRSGLPVVVIFEQRSTNSVLTNLRKKLSLIL